MEKFIKTDDFLSKTALPAVFREAELQKKVCVFLEAMEEKYGDDEQFKYYMEQVKNEKRPKVSFGRPIQNVKLAGFVTRMLDWIRDHEIQVLREEYEQAQKIVSPYFIIDAKFSLKLRGGQDGGEILIRR